MEKQYFAFSAYKGKQIAREPGYHTLNAALKGVKEYQSLGWFVDYIDNTTDGTIAKVIDYNAITKANKVDS